MGMLEAELNPAQHCLHVRFYAHSGPKSDIMPCLKSANTGPMHGNGSPQKEDRLATVY